MMRYELSDYEWRVINPILPNTLRQSIHGAKHERQAKQPTFKRCKTTQTVPAWPAQYIHNS
jgi:hypothetical protein